MDIPGVQFLLERYVRWASRRDPVLPLATEREVRRILVAVTTGMGDVILATPVLDSLRAAFPDAEIALFCRSAWRPLFVNDSRLVSVVPYYGKSRRIISTINALRRFSPDLILAPHINDPDILPILYLSGGRQIIRVPWGTTRYPELLSNRGVAAERFSIPGLHVTDERLRAIESLGVPVVARVPSLSVRAELISALRTRAKRETACESYAVFHVFSADAYRTVPKKLARDCLRAFRIKYPNLGWVLTGSAVDRATLIEIADGLDVGVWVAAGELSIDETAACVKSARAVVAPDTGNLHLAAALNRPLLALLSPTMEAPTRAQVVGPRTASAPVRVLEVPPVCDPCVGRRCPHRPVACLEAFRVEDILEQLELLLAQGKD